MEEDEKLSEELKQLLQAENYRVKTASTLAEADQIINQALPKAVILDVRLPDGSGLDWMRRLRRGEGSQRNYQWWF